MIRKLYKYWLPFILWGIVIFLFSSHPTGIASEIHWQDFVVKKSAHIVEYAILTILLYRALLSHDINANKAALIAILFSVLYGATDEFHQSFTPGREPKIRDVAIDALGSFIAVYSVRNLSAKLPLKIINLLKVLELR